MVQRGTPAGVPVRITSPGSSAVDFRHHRDGLRDATRVCGVARLGGDAVNARRDLEVVVRVSSVSIHGPSGKEVSVAAFALNHWSSAAASRGPSHHYAQVKPKM